jgi:hypothetical protein
MEKILYFNSRIIFVRGPSKMTSSMAQLLVSVLLVVVLTPAAAIRVQEVRSKHVSLSKDIVLKALLWNMFWGVVSLVLCLCVTIVLRMVLSMDLFRGRSVG